MIKLFYRLFNHDKVDELSRTVEIYKERNKQLESEIKEYKGYKLKYEVTKLYVEDDEALIELFEVAKKRDEYIYNCQSGRNQLAGMAAQQQLGAFVGNCGLSGVQALGFYR